MSDKIVSIFKNTDELNRNLGILYEALKHQDAHVASDQFAQLAPKAEKHDGALQALQASLVVVKSWNKPYALLQCAYMIMAKPRKNPVLMQAGLDATLDATMAIAPQDPVTAVEHLVRALKKVPPGTIHEHQVTDQIAHICQNPDPMHAVELLELLMSANNLNYLNQNSEQHLHDRIVMLADMIKAQKPVLALDAYTCVMDDMDDANKTPPENIAASVVELSRQIADYDLESAMMGVETVMDTMPPSSQAFKDAMQCQALLTIESKSPDYDKVPALTPSEFSAFIKPKPFE